MRRRLRFAVLELSDSRVFTELDDSAGFSELGESGSRRHSAF